MNSAASNQKIVRFVNLGKVSEITMGQSPESLSLNTSENGLPFLQGCAEFGRKSPLTTVYCNPPLRVSNPESILISVRAPVGTLNWGDQRYCIGRGLAAIKAVDNLADSEFLFYAIAQNANFLHRRSQGSTFLAISGNDIKIFPVPAFGIESQKKIAHILQTIDQAIEKTEVLIEKYQQIKAGLMHDLFTRGIAPNGQLRPPREQAPELYQQTPIGWIPKEWEVGTLRDMAHPGIAHIKTGPFGSSLKGEHWVSEGVPVITIGALGEGEFIVDELLFITERYSNTLIEYQMKAGQVVFSRVADVGRSVVIESGQEGWVMSSNLMRIHLDSGKADPNYLQSLLSFDNRVKSQIRCKVNSGGRDVANSAVLNSLFFAWPRIEEQTDIVSRASSIDGKITKEKAFLDNLNKQKSGLMHDLLTGKVPVKVERETQPEPGYGESYSHG